MNFDLDLLRLSKKTKKSKNRAKNVFCRVRVCQSEKKEAFPSLLREHVRLDFSHFDSFVLFLVHRLHAPYNDTRMLNITLAVRISVKLKADSVCHRKHFLIVRSLHGLDSNVRFKLNFLYYSCSTIFSICLSLCMDFYSLVFHHKFIALGNLKMCVKFITFSTSHASISIFFPP